MPAADIDAYIAGFPVNIQQRLEQIRSSILEIAPDAAESISYAMPAFQAERARAGVLRGV